MLGEQEAAVRAPIAAFTDQINEQVAVGRMGKRPSIVFEDGDLGAMFKAPTDISFVGTLETAKIKGRNRKKWLLVNVQVLKLCRKLNVEVFHHSPTVWVLENSYL